MKPNFDHLFRGGMILLLCLLSWSLWAAAPPPVATNAPAKTVVSDRTSILNLPVLLEKEAYLTFGLDRVEVLKSELWGNPRWQYVASLIYIFLALFVSKLLDYLISVWLKRWTSRTKTQFDDLLVDLLHGPVKIVSFVIFLHIGLNIFTWPKWVESFLSRGLGIIVAISLTYLALKAVDLLMAYWKRRSASDERGFDEQLFPILRKSLKVFVVIVAFLVTAQNLGLNVTGMIASLSIGGLAIGLAAQDTLANLFGAVAIFGDKPFRLGDVVKVEGVEGVVEAIGMRSTRLRNPEGHLITVPNKTMGNAVITNIAQRPNIKATFNLGLTYDTPAAKVKQAISILEDVFKTNPMTHDVIISFNQFSDSALNIQVVHWYKTKDPREHLLGMHELNLQVKRRFDEEGIAFAFPSRTVYLKQDSEWQVKGVEAGANRSGTRALLEEKESDPHQHQQAAESAL